MRRRLSDRGTLPDVLEQRKEPLLGAWSSRCSRMESAVSGSVSGFSGLLPRLSAALYDTSKILTTRAGIERASESLLLDPEARAGAACQSDRSVQRGPEL